VVVDEVHTYRGIFGSHIAQIFRRLQRICRLYSARPSTFFFRQPLPTRRVCEPPHRASLRAVETNGAPQAGRHFFFINPEARATSVAAKLFIQALKAD